MDTVFDGKCFVSFAATIDDTPEAVTDFFDRQAFALMVKASAIMECVHDIHLWAGALTNLALDVEHKLKEMTDENR